jgi:hypothetical protein
VKVGTPLEGSDADSRASTEAGLTLQAVGSLENPLMLSKYFSHLIELDVVRGLMSWWVVVGHVLAFADFQENNMASVLASIF